MVGFLFVYGYSMTQVGQKVNPSGGFLTNLTQSSVLHEVLEIEVAQLIAEQDPVIRKRVHDLSTPSEVLDSLNGVDQLKELDCVFFKAPEEGG